MIDSDVVKQLIDDIGAEFFNDLLSIYINESFNNFSLLEHSDIEEVRRAAHTIKGTSLSVGLIDLHEYAKNLEHSIKETQEFPTREEVETGKDLLRQSISALQQLIKNNKDL